MINQILLKKKGFSMVEVLIAIAIFSIGILAVNSLQLSSIGSGSNARRITDATYFAAEQMERLISLPYDHDDLSDIDNDKNDLDADGERGLEHTGLKADYEVPDADKPGGYEYINIFWNIAEDDIIENTKTIRVIAEYNFRGRISQAYLQRIIINN